MAWPCRFLTTRRRQHGRIVADNDFVKNYRVHPTHWLIYAQVLCWRELSGVLALVALCAGDGAAEIFGASPFGRRSPRLPWCRRKSVVGTCSFFVATTLGGAAFALYFRGLGWWSVSTKPLLRGVAATAAAAALAESFDTGAWDNPVVFAAAVGAARRAFPTD